MQSPPELVDYLDELDRFIDAKIRPLQAQDDNERFFDHRREWARTDFDRTASREHEWEELLDEAKRRADRRRSFSLFALPVEFGGKGGSNLWMAVIREHLAAKGLGLHNDLQNEHSIVGNFPVIVMLRDFGTPSQKEKLIRGALDFQVWLAFGLTEPDHGSDATHMETRAIREIRDGVPDGASTARRCGSRACTPRRIAWCSRAPTATTATREGSRPFSCRPRRPGLKVEEYLWTFNMPTDHPRVSLTDVWVREGDVVRQARWRTGARAGLRP